MSDAFCDITIEAIAHALCTGARRLPRVDDLPTPLQPAGATFVTLERDGELLGCVGTLDAHQALGVDIAEHALAAAFDDPRVPPITLDDFPVMSVKVSILSDAEPLAANSFDELRAVARPGIDGITIVAGRHRATLLPSVWEKARDPADFLDALWHKAGLRRREWNRHLRASRYTTVEYCHPGPRAPLA